ncbi:MAG: hypothetical protein EPO24_11790 [Bacteroidetes bacterium]|nr:MAG: hypothetical protein EPO24_11790 [Bacteroidota bacterium]
MYFTNDRNSGGVLRGKVTLSGNGFYLVSGGGLYTLDPGEGRYVRIRFLPNRPGNFTGALTIQHDAANRPSPIAIPLSGSATGP